MFQSNVPEKIKSLCTCMFRN